MIECDSRIEIRECNYKQSQYKVVPKAFYIDKRTYKTTGILITESEQNRHHHYSLCKDDGHYSGGIHFQRQILANASVLFIAYHSFSLLYGYFTCALYQKYCKGYYHYKYYKFDKEHNRTAGTVFAEFYDELLRNSLR